MGVGDGRPGSLSVASGAGACIVFPVRWCFECCGLWWGGGSAPPILLVAGSGHWRPVRMPTSVLPQLVGGGGGHLTTEPLVTLFFIVSTPHTFLFHILFYKKFRNIFAWIIVNNRFLIPDVYEHRMFTEKYFQMLHERLLRLSVCGGGRRSPLVSVVGARCSPQARGSGPLLQVSVANSICLVDGWRN